MSALEQLKDFSRNMAQLSEKIDQFDLRELAQIHECAIKIGKIEFPAQCAKVVADFCQAIIASVEDVILEKGDKPKAALDDLCAVIKRFASEIENTNELPDAKTLAQITSFGQPHKNETKSEYQSEPLIIPNQEFEYIQSFLTECRDHIENIESQLLSLEQSPDDIDKINELFRPFHTIKGMAGFLNLKDVGALTHEIETLLDLGRKGNINITDSIIDIIFEALDILKVQVNLIAQHIASPTDKPIPQPPINDFLLRVRSAATENFPQKTVAPSTSHRPIGEILAEDSKVTPELVDFALEQQKETENKPIGTILTSMGAVSARDVSQALRKQKTEIQDNVVRVATAKLDSLINAIGELIIIQTQVEEIQAVKLTPKLARLVHQISKITRDVQEIGMSMRMVPIGPTFQKMGRLIRDLSKKVSKKINYEIEGEETQLDKTVIQELSDPLMHMIRNAVDHGMETPDERLKAGKPETGTVKLKAFHQGGNVVIEICDDGKGLDKKVLIRKAVEKGLVAPDAQLSEQQAFQLILAPGFSTAEKVTEVSGRGVGMDVVKKNIEKLHGKIEIKSTIGLGTTFIFRLPLTLAVIDAMIIRVGNQKFILPMLSIIRSLAPAPEQIKTIQDRGMILNLHQKIYPLLPLGSMFDIPQSTNDPTKGIIVITQAQDSQIGLIVDELLGQQQVVIKPLGETFKTVTGVTGGAILGDGTIGLIIEPAGLLEIHNSLKEARP